VLERIGPRYLLLGTEAGPAVEFKWAPVKGAFSHSKLIRRLIQTYGKQPEIRIEESALPENWKSALKAFEVTGFVWETASVGGKGVILYCPDCRNATLVQFYHHDYDCGRQPFDCMDRRVLASFQDHRRDGQIVWSVFDIRAVIPAEYALARYRFEPGRFELSFVSGSSSVTLYRWGPAAVLLSGGSLESFIERAVPLPSEKETKRVKAGANRVEFSFEESAASSRRLRLHRSRTCRVQAWHDDQSNRILCVRFEAKPSEAQAAYHAIVSRYETQS